MKTPKIKTYVLMVSTKYPSYHKKKGERTKFVCKILHTINYDGGIEMYNICGNECKSSCERRMLDQKLHTIRANYPLWEKRIKEVQEGKAVLSIRYWSGKPYNSKQVEVCQLDKDSGIGIQKLEFDSLLGIFIDSYDSDITKKDLAQNDGLSLDDFKEWFKPYDLSEPMAVIWFVNKRY